MKSPALIVIVLGMLTFGSLTLYTITGPATGQNTTTNVSANKGPGQSGYTPYGAWATDLGYIPTGYKIAPKAVNSVTWPCPSGLNGTQCQLFQQTCGNGVCDPNERCDTCPIDCGVTGALVCDPFTGRPGAPATVCQLVASQQKNSNP